MILRVERNKAIIDNSGGEESVSLAHAHEVNGVSVEDGDDLKVVERWLIEETLIPQTEVDQRLATYLDLWKLVT